MTRGIQTVWQLALGWAVIALVILGTACGGSNGAAKTATVGATSTSASVSKPSAAVLTDLAPTGKLRVAFTGPAIIAQNDSASGQLVGIGVDLAKALALKLGVTFAGIQYDTPAQVVAAGNAGAWDVAFLPNPDPKLPFDFASSYMLIPHTYLVNGSSLIKSVADADQTGVRIASLDASGHTQVLAGLLKQAQLVRVDTDDAGIALLKSGGADAYADARLALIQFQQQVPGSRLLTEDWFVAKPALAVSRGHAAGLAYLWQFIEDAKASGDVQRAIDEIGTQALTVAPAGPAPTAQGTAASTPGKQ
jgi:polar amino acid transport system substrate-binding protein